MLSARPNSASQNICPQCGWDISIREIPTETRYREGDFQGGYPFTRALEMVEAILITIGVTDQHKVVQVWEDILGHNRLQKLYHDIQHVDSYLEMIRYFGKLINREEKLSIIKDGFPAIIKKPRVYYAMGKPLFPLEKERMENQLIKAAGGISVNQEINCVGRPGRRICAEDLNALNPEVIFISAFLSSSVEDFYEACCQAGITADAVKHRQIYTPPAPGWDFGSPRWILGLQYIANMLHPEIYHFDVFTEAQRFYAQFYGTEFSLTDVNRSFCKPSSKWTWKEN